MNQAEILAKVDHTLLLQGSTWEEIKVICEDAVRYGTASVCIPPCYVEQAAGYLKELQQTAEDHRVVVCTVIGFPNGNMTTGAKCFEAKEALECGAEEIDMVINIGWVKAGRFDLVEEEIRRIKEVCGEHVLKVIIETCLLTEQEKIEMCHVVSRSGADFIKTSTGFSTAGATPEDVKLFAEHVEPHVQIKAAGGISSFDDAALFLELGASRLGTSRLVKIIKGQTGSGY